MKTNKMVKTISKKYNHEHDKKILEGMSSRVFTIVSGSFIDKYEAPSISTNPSIEEVIKHHQELSVYNGILVGGYFHELMYINCVFSSKIDNLLDLVCDEWDLDNVTLGWYADAYVAIITSEWTKEQLARISWAKLEIIAYQIKYYDYDILVQYCDYYSLTKLQEIFKMEGDNSGKLELDNLKLDNSN